MDQPVYPNAFPGTFLSRVLDQPIYWRAFLGTFHNRILDQPVYPNVIPGTSAVGSNLSTWKLFQEPSSIGSGGPTCLPECYLGTFLNRVLDQPVYLNAILGTFLNRVLDQPVYPSAIPGTFLNRILDQPVYLNAIPGTFLNRVRRTNLSTWMLFRNLPQ